MKHTLLAFALVLAVACEPQAPTTPTADWGNSFTGTEFGPMAVTGGPDFQAAMVAANEHLEQIGSNIRVEEIHFFTIGPARPANRILGQPFRWVANDPRRVAQGDDLTYIVDQSGGATASGLTNAQTEPAVDAAFASWAGLRALRKVTVDKRADPGTDITIFDFFFCGGMFGNFTAADIVNAGWFPSVCFNPNTLAFSVTFIFTGGDSNGDQRLDTALNEIYYNDRFDGIGAPPWDINVALGSGIDVQTVALHEEGHSFGVGHFGPAPTAVMNPVYAGIRHSLFRMDEAAVATILESWPK